MNILRTIFPVGHFVISLLCIGCALALIGFAGFQFWQGVQPISPVALSQRRNAVLDSMALLTVAVATLELGQTIMKGTGSRTPVMFEVDDDADTDDITAAALDEAERADWDEDPPEVISIDIFDDP
jgi:hypothetical protein